jgi:hypothetical protein
MYLGGPAPVEAVWPQLAVTWKGAGENFCALVRCNSSRNLRVQLYSFDDASREITANLWELAPGAYEATVGPDQDQDGRPDASAWRAGFQAASPAKLRTPTPLRFALPARTLTALEVRPH